jgi:hypothetical protein
MTVRDDLARRVGKDAYSKQYVEAQRGEPARLAAEACSQVRRPRACEAERFQIDPARG